MSIPKSPSYENVSRLLVSHRREADALAAQGGRRPPDFGKVFAEHLKEFLEYRERCGWDDPCPVTGDATARLWQDHEEGRSDELPVPSELDELLDLYEDEATSDPDDEEPDEDDSECRIAEEDFDRLLDEFIAGASTDAVLPDNPSYTVGDDEEEVAPEPAPEAESAMDKLMAMTGMQAVKDAVMCQINYHKVMKLRSLAGKKTPKRLMHMLLTGNPGTGKTTVARLIGRIFKEHGMLSQGHFVEANRAMLVGQYLGESENKTSELIEKARGGVLFIDEIYSLVAEEDGAGSKRDFGIKVLDTLMPVLSDVDSDLIVIGAGYTSNMKVFLNGNPGLASRFPLVLEFSDLSHGELMEIACSELARYDFTLSEEARAKVETLIADAMKIKDFGNARFVLNLVNNHIISNLCNRLVRENGGDAGSLGESNSVEPSDIPDLRKLFPLSGERRRAAGFTGNH